MGHQWGGVVQRDAADRADRQVQLLAGLVEQVEAAGRCAGLGGGIEEAAEGDISGALPGSLLGQFELRVAGRADDGFGAEQGAGRRQRAIGLAQMHAHVQACGELGVVVDDQSGLVAFTQIAQGLGLAQSTGFIAALVAILQQGDAAFQRRLHVRKEFTGQQLAVGNGVQAT
ncbi:hypothetical protein D9M71_636480 [compost metagenome]